MNPSAILHRRLCLIRNTEAPYHYPSKEELLARFAEMDFPSKARRSLERDIRELRDEYGIHIRYDHYRRGYYLHIPPDEEVEDFQQFVTLLERHKRLSFLQKAITNVQEVGKYLQLELSEQFAGAENLPHLWDALRSQRVIQFKYAPYTDSAAPPAQRTVEPGILFEYRNRWYLDGWDVDKNALRTFGLDRITHLYLKDNIITTDRTATYKNLRRHVIGVTAPEGAEPERVVLRFNALQSRYVRSLPLHPSQRELAKLGEFELFVILNPELEKEILSFGEAVEVLEPGSLHALISEKIKKSNSTYDKISHLTN